MPGFTLECSCGGRYFQLVLEEISAGYWCDKCGNWLADETVKYEHKRIKEKLKGLV